jgi:glycosyltransferase involved in cell wall biosynthesis
LRILLVGDYPNNPLLGSSKVLYKLQQEFSQLGHTCDLLLAGDLGRRPAKRPWREAAGPLLAWRAIHRRVRERGPYDIIDVASGEGCLVALERRLGRYGSTVVVSRSNGLEHLNYRRMVEDHHEGLLRKPWPRRIWYPLVRLTQVRLAARFADRVLLLNEADRQFAITRGWKAPDRIDIVPHGVAPEFLQGRPPPAEARGAGVLFCGSWSDVKGVPYLTAAWSRVVDERPSQLTVLGGGVPAQVIKAAFEPKARRSVTVIDRVPEDQVRHQYRRHDLLVFPSTYEGFGMVVLEAMTQGLPVIATPVGCVPSLVACPKSFP